MNRESYRALLSWFCLATMASGCMIHRPAHDVDPIIPAAAGYDQAPSERKNPPTAFDDWWQSFRDPTLHQLINTALSDNLELKQLTARIAQADALLRQAGGRLFPTLDGSGSYESRWTDRDDSTSTSREESVSLTGLLSWELDVWGRLRSAKRARAFGSNAAVHDWEGGRLLLSTSVAETYFEILEHHAQLRLVQAQININQTLLDLTKLRFGQGQSSIVDVLQQQEQLASTRARVPDIESRLEQLQYTLEVLLGRAPSPRAQFAVRALSAPPPLPETGLPSDLLGNRPDLLTSRELIIATDYRVGEAIADRLPRFVIGGSLTAAGDPGIHQLITSAFASLAGPIFDGGTRRAEVDLRQAQLREALAEYSNAYLTAVREVETALLRERKQEERVQLLENQLTTAQRLLTETRNRYSQGLTDYLPVLAAVVTEQNLEREFLTSQRELLSFRVALHRALGGPMNNSRDPAPTNNLL